MDKISLTYSLNVYATGTAQGAPYNFNLVSPKSNIKIYFDKKIYLFFYNFCAEQIFGNCFKKTFFFL